MTDTAFACRHDMSAESTLTLEIALSSEQYERSSVKCSVCTLRLLAAETAALGFSSEFRSWATLASARFAYAVRVSSNSWPTGNNSSSPVPIPAEADTNGRVGSPTRFLSSRVSACTSPSMLLKLVSGFKGRRIPGVVIEWAGQDHPMDSGIEIADMHTARNRMTLHGGKVRLTRSSDGLTVEASLAELDEAAREKS